MVNMPKRRCVSFRLRQLEHCDRWTQVGDVYEVRLPSDVQTLLGRMSVVVTFGISFGLKMTPLACVGLDGFASELLFWMVTPLVLVMVILVAVCLRRVSARTSAVAKTKERMRDESWSAGKLSLAAAPYVLRLLL